MPPDDVAKNGADGQDRHDDPGKKDTDASPPSREEFETVMQQIQQATSRAERAEAALMDPAYINYVAGKAAEQRTDAGHDDTREPKIKPIGEWTANDLGEFVRLVVKGETQGDLQKLEFANAVTAARKQCDEAATKFPDFWEFKEDMAGLAKQIPNLTAERAYLIAKAERGPKKPPASGEAPPSIPGTRIRREPTKGGLSAAKLAWQKVFGSETLAS